MANWPVALKINRSNYRESPPENSIRSGMDTGPDKVRRRTTANIRPVSFSLFLTDAELETLDEFYVVTLYSGSLPFFFEHPRTGDTMEARFREPPDYTFEETMYRVNCTLEILP